MTAHGFPAELVAHLDEPPLLGPVRMSSGAEAYRWLGSGRGESYVQVEVGPEAIIVHGAHGDAQLPMMTLPAR